MKEKHTQTIHKINKKIESLLRVYNTNLRKETVYCNLLLKKICWKKKEDMIKHLIFKLKGETFIIIHFIYKKQKKK